MANTLRPYLTCIRTTLQAALCIRNFPSQTVERHNRPEVEDGSSKELVLNTLVISRSERESVMIEPSVNSVRMSLRIKQMDDIDKLLVKKFSAFLQQRAEAFVVLRRLPVPGYDLSFLITHSHCEDMVKARLVEFVISFMEDVDKEISAMKIAINARARSIATGFMESLARGSLPPGSTGSAGSATNSAATSVMMHSAPLAATD